ncbi:hypothetical protein IP88_06940 [alpha proteobacterium AAP81b]|nr:hypothetical protein IP88_06940 [alpha proteobacterium AAP81b]
MDRAGLGFLVVATAFTLFAASPRLTLAFEDAGDPAPHRFAMTAEVAGRCAGLVISWSERLR